MRHLRFEKSSILATIAFLFLMLDSGGEFGLRLVGIFIFLVLATPKVTRLSINKNIIFGWLFLCLCITPACMRSAINGVELKDIVTWTLPILGFPAIYVLATETGLKDSSFATAGLIFSIVTITLFVGRLLAYEPILIIQDMISERTSGFFNEKKAFFEDALPVVYFQGTLNLVFCAILAFSKKKYFSYITILVALIVAPSRFGVLTVVVISAILFINRLDSTQKKMTAVIGSIAIVTAAIFSMPSGLSDIFDSQSGGASVRTGHVDSISNEVSFDPSIFLIGSGPGSRFYSSGFGEYTDNIEISQLEILRKFGFIFALGVCLIICATSVKVISKSDDSGYALIGHFIVSFSNPVLLSIPALFLISLCLQRATSALKR